MEDHCAVPRVSLQPNFGPTASSDRSGLSPTQQNTPSLHTCRLLSGSQHEWKPRRHTQRENGPADQKTRPNKKPTDASRNGNDEAAAATSTTSQHQHQHQHQQQREIATSTPTAPRVSTIAPSLQAIIEKQQQIIAGQAEMIEALGRELSHRAEELARGAVIREELDRLVRMTETAEEDAGRQVAALETEVLRLTELLDARRDGENGHP